MTSLFSLTTTLTLALLSGHGNCQVQQTVLHGQPHERPLKVAIIGAGAAGSSTAYHLSRYAAEADLPINITIYDKNTYVGGRSTTVNVYGSQDITAELGASIFVEVNQILVDAVQEFNLSSSRYGSQSSKQSEAPSLGIWNGERFVVTLSPSGPSWWDTAKLLWKYGLSPIRTRSLMKSTVGKFLQMYKEPYFPFASLNQAVANVDLLDTTAQTGAKYLVTNKIGRLFAHDIIQASTRVNYAQNLVHIHGLETMVCMATDGAMSVEAGNWQIFSHMIQASSAHLMLETQITSIKADGDLFTVSMESHDKQSIAYENDFDAVVLAAPYHQTNIDFDLPNQSMPEDIEYVNLHVTIFTSPFRLARAAFNIAQDQEVPLTILTTLPAYEQPRDGSDSAGSPGFYSISTLDLVQNPETDDLEYLYKIFSPREAEDDWIMSLLEVVPGVQPVSWIERKLWQSYPQEKPRREFDDIEMSKDVWYTGGMEPFISTMETNALMGKNVANLIVSRFAKDHEV